MREVLFGAVVLILVALAAVGGVEIVDYVLSHAYCEWN